MAKLITLCIALFGFIVVWGNTNYSNLKSCDLRDSVVAHAEKYIGVQELGGNNRGPEVEYFLSKCGLGGGYAWCSCFVVAIFEEVGITHNMTAWSPSCCGDNSKLVYYNEKFYNDYQYIPKASTFGLFYNGLGRIGHTGIIVKVEGKYVWTIEGNTTIGGSERDGEGVALRKRNIKSVYKISDFVKDDVLRCEIERAKEMEKQDELAKILNKHFNNVATSGAKKYVELEENEEEVMMASLISSNKIWLLILSSIIFILFIIFTIFSKEPKNN